MPDIVDWRLVVGLFGIGWVFSFLLGTAIGHAITIRGQLLFANMVIQTLAEYIGKLKG